MAAAGPAAAAGKENVWSYPRPPLCEPSPKRLRVYCGDLLLADTTQGWAIKETSHPPTYYLPRADVRMELLRPAGTSGSLCEYKGRAEYYDVVADGKEVKGRVWSYPTPTERYAPIADHLAFYATSPFRCFVDEELVTPQPGGFYGGWITSNLEGPFKGGQGSMGW